MILYHLISKQAHAGVCHLVIIAVKIIIVITLENPLLYKILNILIR